ncbi:LysR family transcriptional regulator [Paenibacillus sp. R14(2021)]|uniref:LysR family transcriptional regulator n=1 Tax=Paenibacillus sp. R14(2021) TaxID=2859228 RepID=UPI001C616650|nr:LysR family transcriptional regulator [Paenibacillus sp. R14(2021)]
MQVEWFRSFTEAAKWKSFSKAADRLNLTQPAISKQIRQLEAVYGVELFQRSASGVELTKAGRQFMAQIIPVVTSLENIEVYMRQYKSEPGYKLGCLPSLAAQFLLDRLRVYRASNNRVMVKVRQTSIELLDGLQESSFDAALMDADFVGAPMWSKTLFTEGYIAVLQGDHPLRERTSLRLEELKDERFVFATSKCEIHDRVRSLVSSSRNLPDVQLEFEGNKEFLLNVAVGAGITVLPGLLRAEAELMGLHAVPLAEPELYRTIVLAARTADIGSKLYRRLLSNK